MTVFLLLWLCFSFKTSAQEICNCKLSADQLMLLAVEKARDNDRLKQQHLTYKENYTLEEFDYIGVKKSTEKKTTSITGQKRNLAGFDLSIGELLHLLVTRHNFTFANPIEISDGSESYLVLNFKPKENLTSGTNEDKFINRLEGKLLIDARTYSLYRVEAKIPEDKQFEFRAWRFVFFVTIEMKSFTLTFQQKEYRGITVEDSIKVEANFRVLNSTRTRKYTYLYLDHGYR